MPVDSGISEPTAGDAAEGRQNRVGHTNGHITKQVSVMMPFGGDKPKRRRRFVLEFMRLRYLIENKTTVVNEKIDKKISYLCKAFRARVGDIPRDGMQVVAQSDILIGLVSEKNVNVIYELAVRNLLKDEMLVILKGERDLLPIYLRNMPFLEYDSGEYSAVAELMDDMSRNRTVLNFEDEIPPELRKKIDEYDEQFLNALNVSLGTVENNCPKRQSYILDLVQDLDPGLLLGKWVTYTPVSIVQIRWKQKSGGVGYVPEDMDGPPIIYSGNDHFRYLFNMADEIPDPNGPNPLTQEQLLERITPFLLDGNIEAFERDQARLGEAIFLGDGFGQAEVPMEITADHPRDGYKNKVFLPCMIGKRTVGDTYAPHMTYLLIAFVEDFWPEAYKRERASHKARKEKKASLKAKKKASK